MMGEAIREHYDTRVKAMQLKINQQSHYLPEARIEDLKDLYSVYVWELRQSLICLEERLYEQDFKNIHALFKIKLPVV